MNGVSTLRQLSEGRDGIYTPQALLQCVEEYVSLSTPMATGYDDVNARNARLKDIVTGTAENGGQSTEVLLIQLIGAVTESNKLLREIVEYNSRQDVKRAKEEEEQKSKDEDEKKQRSDATGLQVMTSGSIIAIFVASLDVATLSYAHDILSDRESGATPVKFTDKFAIGCWFVSLLLSIIVVIVGTMYTFAQSWMIFAEASGVDFDKEELPEENNMERGGNIEDGQEIPLSPDNVSTHSGTNSTSLRSISQSEVNKELQFVFTLTSVVFNALVMPSLFAFLVGLFVFAWAEQPRLASISMTSFAGAIWLLTLVVFLGILIGYRKELRAADRAK